LDNEIEFKEPPDVVGRLLYRAAFLAAALAGLLVLVLALLTAINVPLKQILGQPLRGEFEIVDLGVATAVFAFLPLAQFVRGYVVLDLSTSFLGRRTTVALDAVAGILFAAAMAIVAWRMLIGGFDIYETGERTTILHLEYWWTFVVAVPSLILLCAVCVYMAWCDIGTLRR
jgi:TRAP-type C4-dicarboxylate transport system permease small subunit